MFFYEIFMPFFIIHKNDAYWLVFLSLLISPTPCNIFEVLLSSPSFLATSTTL